MCLTGTLVQRVGQRTQLLARKLYPNYSFWRLEVGGLRLARPFHLQPKCVLLTALCFFSFLYFDGHCTQTSSLLPCDWCGVIKPSSGHLVANV